MGIGCKGNKRGCMYICRLIEKEGARERCCILGCGSKSRWGYGSCGIVLYIPDCFDLHMWPGIRGKHAKYKAAGGKKARGKKAYYLDLVRGNFLRGMLR